MLPLSSSQSPEEYCQSLVVEVREIAEKRWS